MKYDAVIVASGVGKRANLGFNKVLYVMKNKKTVLENACSLFIEDRDCEKVIVVTNENINLNNIKVIVTKGGESRYDSVVNGLKLVNSEYVLIHDGARPFLTREELEKVKDALNKDDGVILATKAIETIKYVEDGYIVKTINRDNIYAAQTPQGFKTEVIKKAYQDVDYNGVTDDASVLEKLGLKVKIVEGNKTNIKLTNSEDFENI